MAHLHNSSKQKNPSALALGPSTSELVAYVCIYIVNRLHTSIYCKYYKYNVYGNVMYIEIKLIYNKIMYMMVNSNIR